MRAKPRTWPSMRVRRFRQDDFVSGCMLAVYPMGVYIASGVDTHRGYRSMIQEGAQMQHETVKAGSDGAACCGQHGSKHEHAHDRHHEHGHDHSHEPAATLVREKDPVCGM